MNRKGYTLLGWLVWRIGSRVAKRKIARKRGRLGAGGAITLLLLGGALAAKSASTGD
ncbi:MAG TPA: hypothetical protein VH817_17515 [Thermoleophilaceae bacterium]|jgi:hypothetical protein